MHRRTVASMEIRVHSRQIIARYQGCTTAAFILLRRYGHEEFKNVDPLSVQKAHKAVLAGQYLRHMQRRIVPSKEIRLHSRLILARCTGCTNAKFISSRRCGHEEFINVNLSRCKRRPKLYEPVNISVQCIAVQCLQWKFAYIRD